MLRVLIWLRAKDTVLLLTGVWASTVEKIVSYIMAIELARFNGQFKSETCIPLILSPVDSQSFKILLPKADTDWD